jgi:phosphoribosylpyrophosphate synthetase
MEPRDWAVAGRTIKVLGRYRPYRYHCDCGGDSRDYPSHSGRILDLKERKAHGVRHFFNYLRERVDGYDAIAVVPSHDAEKTVSGVHDLGTMLADNCDLVDAGACLVRHTTIPKLAGGGGVRAVKTHLASIRVEDAGRVRKQYVLLLDDIATSGTSLLACRKLLLDAGAAGVEMLALGLTDHDPI